VPDPSRRLAAAAGVDGLFLRCWCDDRPWRTADVERVLRALVPADLV